MNALLEKFKILHSELKDLLSQEQPDEEILQKKIMKYIAYMTEDHRNKESQENIFDYFCENNGISILSSILQKNGFIAIKAYSLLFINLRDQIWVNYILCQPFIKEAIEARCDVDEEQWTQYYISFLKSLSIRLNETQISLFYNKKHCTYPIVYEAMKYFNHPDFMVRTSVMNIILQLMKINDSHSHQYFSRFPFSSYLVTFTCQVYELFSKMNKKLRSENESGLEKLLLNYEVDLSDYLQYFNDLIQFGTSKVAEVIRCCFKTYLMKPLFKMIASEDDRQVIHCLLLLLKYTQIIKDKEISEELIVTLLRPRIQSQVLKYYKEEKEIYFPMVHQSKFNSLDYYWDHYKNEIINHCLQVFDHISQFEVDYEITHHKDPEFLAEIRKISEFIGFDLLENRKVENSDLNEKKSEILVLNPFRAALIKHLKSHREVVSSLALSLIYKLTKNALTFNIQLVEQQPQENENFQEISKIIFKGILTFDSKITSTNQLENMINFYKFSNKHKLSLINESQLKKKVTKVSEQLMQYVTKQNINEIVQNFSIQFEKTNAKISSEKIDFNFSFAHCLLKNNSEGQQKMVHSEINELIKSIRLKIKEFWIYHIFTKEYMENFHYKSVIDFKQEYSQYFQNDIWQVNQRYKIKQKKTLTCDIFSVDLKKPIRVTVIEDPYNFMIAETESDTTYYKLIVVSSWVQVSFELKRDDPTIIETTVWTSDKVKQFSLVFEDQVRSCSALSSFNDVKWGRYEEQLYFIYKFLKNSLQNE